MHDEQSVNIISIADLPTSFGFFRIIAFTNSHDKNEHVALVYGDVKDYENVLVRIHSECLTGDAFCSLRCDCHDQLHLAMNQIAKEKRGVLIYLRQEGRGIGLHNKIQTYALQDQGLDTFDANIELGLDVDNRNYVIAAEVLDSLGVKSVRLMTNNPEKLSQLEKHGVNIKERIPSIGQVNKHNQKYLKTKFQKAGHLIEFKIDDQHKLKNDVWWMDVAVDKAKRNDPYPNPRVGAIIVLNGALVGAGNHAVAGHDHAEVSAIKNAGNNTFGATLYVTLEPCNHYGRTPPCTNAIIQAGIERVVIGISDPNKSVCGGGIEALRAANIDVRVGVRDIHCKNLIKDWIEDVLKKE